MVSQQIRDLVTSGQISVDGNLKVGTDGRFVDGKLEGRVQPSSFEPTLGDEVFVLDTEQNGVFRPEANESVYRSLLRLPMKQRVQKSLDGGFEAKSGFTYLIPLREKVRLEEGERLRSSPKSSVGRLFPITRLLGDYTPLFDDVSFSHTENREIDLWLLFQPTAFNVVLHPWITLNQLRFFRGLDASLSQREIIEEFSRNPLLYTRGQDGKLVPAKPEITDDGLALNLELRGENTGGIVALRARRNPDPIDLAKKGFYDAERFFEPVKGVNDSVRLHKGESYLLSSAEVLHVLAKLSADLRKFHGSGIRGKFQEAGFADNDFLGDMVAEVVLNEDGTLSAKGRTIFSYMEFFRTNMDPDKLYGTEIGSHYQGQVGPKVSKHFKPFDYVYAAKNYRRLDRIVLTQPAGDLMNHRISSEGFEPIDGELAAKLIADLESNPIWHSRYDCEGRHDSVGDERVLQGIPYILLFGEGGRVFTYIREKDVDDPGDERLLGKYSFGVGGHIIQDDKPNYVEKGSIREIGEEVRISGEYKAPRIVGTLVSRERPVDRVHFGLVYVTSVPGEIGVNEKSITKYGMKTQAELMQEMERFETWSKLLIPHLPMLASSAAIK